MDKYRNDEIEYENGWQNVSYPVVIEHSENVDDNSDSQYQNDTQDEQNENSAEKHSAPARPIQLITVQLIVCLFIALVVFLLKSMGSEAFKKFGAWYAECMEQTLISDKTFEDINLSQMLGSTADEVNSTPDENKATPN